MVPPMSEVELGDVQRELAAGEILWRVKAPRICGYCRPGLELGIGIAAVGTGLSE